MADTMSSTKITTFWQSINILIAKPHLVNKRLWGCNLLCKYICRFDDCNWEAVLRDLSLRSTDEVQSFMKLLFDKTKLKPYGNENQVIKGQTNVVEVILIELLPKVYTESHGYQVVCLQKNAMTATFYNVTPKHYSQNLCPNFDYTFQLLNENIIVISNSDQDSMSYKWLLKKVLPQINRWTDQHITSNKTILIKDSLALVHNNKYYSKYNNLKLKYGKEMVKIWPECTDPTKFVFEDVAIATYLLLLWDENNSESRKSVTFIDVGCGNGLLVYILTKEGHKGLGVDVRKRKIWDMYEKDIKLEEKIITPENIQMFSGFDWIIGNHSDELTPWIPVMALRSSYSCNFFLLPCCAYNFDGTKYQRQNSSVSQYNEYLDYIYKLCENCGFHTEIDRLKIPSTKRICLVGRTRKYMKDQHDIYIKKVLYIVNNSKTSDTEKENFQSNVFKARNPVEKVRNCTQIDKSVIASIITSITTFLLDGCCIKDGWTAGKEVYIVELIELIPQETLKILKAECGGIQTLLKNNHHIFKVHKGKVQLKYPKTIAETMNVVGKQVNKNAAAIRVQVKPCWFYNNHPQGCPLSDTSCSFLHAVS